MLPGARLLMSSSQLTGPECLSQGAQLFLLKCAHGRAAFDEHIPQTLSQGLGHQLAMRQQMLGQEAFAGSHFDDHEGIRVAQQCVDLGCLPRHGLSEDRVNVRTGIKITIPADSLGAGIRRARVVAELWVVQGEFHEAGEGNRSITADLGGNGSN